VKFIFEIVILETSTLISIRVMINVIRMNKIDAPN